ncbi:ER membrane glycoprotein subunit of the GPI transamidase complex-like protein [Oleoguttula sp. CCFEE 5521]
MLGIIKTYTSTSRIGSPAVRKPAPGSPPPAPTIAVDAARLNRLFWAWKLLLVLIAIATPGPGYDTSTDLWLASDRYTDSLPWFAWPAQRLVSRLVRWDALYFVTSSTRGHQTEQEWAFSRPHAIFTSLVAKFIPHSLHPSLLVRNALAVIAVSHAAHLGAILVLYLFVRSVIPSSEQRKAKIAYTAACLHIISPAGIFLSAPYGEASYAFWSFLGALCCSIATKDRQSHLISTVWLILSGFSFGCSALVRSNGVLNGTIFAADAGVFIYRYFTRPGSDKKLFPLVWYLAAGALTGLGFVLPQLLAYLEYCTGGNTRPWCTHLPPSIYTFVQSHYWNVGLFNYWTLSNAPLFLLATPMLAILFSTACTALHHGHVGAEPTRMHTQQIGSRDDDEDMYEAARFVHVMRRLALPQMLLVGLAFSSFHVQIVNRISSGYPLWYAMLAMAVHGEADPSAGKNYTVGRYALFSRLGKWSGVAAQWTVRVMVLYAVVQAALFASFLPPA